MLLRRTICTFALWAKSPANKTHYQVLGVDQRATAAQIKAAYFTLVKQYHPDQNKQQGAEDTFKEIVKAYETLKDPVKRQIYDMGQGGAQGFDYNAAGQGFSAGGEAAEGHYYEQPAKREYYENRWYGFRKPDYDTQFEEFRAQVVEQSVTLVMLRRVVAAMLLYGCFDYYRHTMVRKHKKLLGTQKELVVDQLEVRNPNLEQYIQERQEEYE